MTYEDFVNSGTLPSQALENSEPLQALWLEKHDKWDEAHTIAQNIPTEIGSAVHAYLHRVEGDLGNARYWYNRANREPFTGTIPEEWTSLVKELL